MTHGEDPGPETREDSAVLTYLEGLLMHPVEAGPGATAGQEQAEQAGAVFQHHSRQVAAPEAGANGPALGSSQHLKKARLLQSGAWNHSLTQPSNPPALDLKGRSQHLHNGSPEVPAGAGESTLLASLLQSFSSRLQSAAVSQPAAKAAPAHQDSLGRYPSAAGQLKGLSRPSKHSNRSGAPYGQRGRGQDRASESPKSPKAARGSTPPSASSAGESVSCAERLKAVASMARTRCSPAASPKPSVACSQLALLLSSEAHFQQYSQGHALRARFPARCASQRLAAIANQQQGQDPRPSSAGGAAAPAGLSGGLAPELLRDPRTPPSTCGLSRSWPAPGPNRSPSNSSREKRGMDWRPSRPPQTCSSLLLLLLNNQGGQKQLTRRGHLEEGPGPLALSCSSSAASDSESSQRDRGSAKDSSDAESCQSCSPMDLSLRARDGGPRDGGPWDGGPRDGGPRDGGPRDGGPRASSPASTLPTSCFTTATSSASLPLSSSAVGKTFSPCSQSCPSVSAVLSSSSSSSSSSSTSSSLLTSSLDKLTESLISRWKPEPEAWKGLMDRGPEAWKGLMDRGPEAWKGLMDTGPEAWKGLMDRGPEAWKGLMDRGPEAWKGLMDTGPEASQELKPPPKVTLMQLLLERRNTEAAPGGPEERDPRASASQAPRGPANGLRAPEEGRIRSPLEQAGAPAQASYPSSTLASLPYLSPHTQSSPLDLCTSKSMSPEPAPQPAFSASKMLQNLAQSSSSASPPSKGPAAEGPGPAGRSPSTTPLSDRPSSCGTPGLKEDIQNLLEKRTVLQLLLGTASHKSRLSGSTRDAPGGRGHRGHRGHRGQGASHSVPDLGPKVHQEAPATENHSRYGLLSQLLKQQSTAYCSSTAGPLPGEQLHQARLVPEHLPVPGDPFHVPGPKKRRLCYGQADLFNHADGPSQPSFSSPQEEVKQRPKVEEEEASLLGRDGQGFNVLKQLLLSDNCLKELSQDAASPSASGAPGASSLRASLTSGPPSQLAPPLPGHVLRPQHKADLGAVVKQEPGSAERWAGQEAEHREALDSPQLSRSNPILYYMLQKGSIHLSRKLQEPGAAPERSIKEEAAGELHACQRSLSPQSLQLKHSRQSRGLS